MGLLYRLVHGTAFALALPAFALRGKRYLPLVRPRLGFPPPPPAPGGIWIQAVSVGEVGVAEVLVRQLRALGFDRPIAITTTTPTGQERARRLFPEGSVGFFPFDFASSCRRAVRSVRPAAFVLVETEIWPGILEALAEEGVPIVLANARISDKSFPRYLALRPLLRSTFDRISLALAASPDDARRLHELGIPRERIEVTGNLKYDREPPAPLAWESRLPEIQGGRALLAAGSTSDGEEPLVLEAFATASGNGERAILLLAPRHPERFDEVARLVESSGLRLLRRSRLDADEPIPGRVDVLLLDALGELARAYAPARGAFVGGSLTGKRGGQNPIEPAMQGIPVAIGPHHSNFRDAVALLRSSGGLEIVSNGADLTAAFARWIEDPGAAARAGESARSATLANRGAAERTARRLIERVASGGRTDPGQLP